MTKPRWANKPEGSNWGRFGVDDQRGKMNLLTPERRVAAVAEVNEGIAFTLSLPLDYPGGNAIFPFRKPPRLHHEQRAGAGYNFNFRLSHICNEFCDIVCDDAVMLYLQYSTQWDGLCHVGQMFDADGDGVPEKVYYNGYRGGVEIVGPGDVSEGFGAHALGIENFAIAGVQGRGVLVDLHRIYGRKRAFVGYDELMRALDGQKVGVEAGDFLCLYTGYGDMIMEMNNSPMSRSCTPPAPPSTGATSACSMDLRYRSRRDLLRQPRGRGLSGAAGRGRFVSRPAVAQPLPVQAGRASRRALVFHRAGAMARRARPLALPADRAAAAAAGRGRFAVNADRDGLNERRNDPRRRRVRRRRTGRGRAFRRAAGLGGRSRCRAARR